MLWFLKFITKAKCRSVQSSPSPMLTCTAHNNSSKITIVIITAVVPADVHKSDEEEIERAGGGLLSWEELKSHAVLSR